MALRLSTSKVQRLRAWLTLALLVATPAMAQSPARDAVVLDSARSRAEFRVRVAWLLPVRGYFERVRGLVEIDRFRNQAVVDAHIDGADVRMRVRGYENWVKSAEFFDVATYPDIHFVSSPFPLQRLVTGGDLPGQLTLRGIDQSVRFSLAESSCDRPGYDCPIVASGTILRSQFGMHSRRGALADKVQLSFRILVANDGLSSKP